MHPFKRPTYADFLDHIASVKRKNNIDISHGDNGGVCSSDCKHDNPHYTCYKKPLPQPDRIVKIGNGYITVKCNCMTRLRFGKCSCPRNQTLKDEYCCMKQFKNEKCDCCDCCDYDESIKLSNQRRIKINGQYVSVLCNKCFNQCVCIEDEEFCCYAHYMYGICYCDAINEAKNQADSNINDKAKNKVDDKTNNKLICIWGLACPFTMLSSHTDAHYTIIEANDIDDNLFNELLQKGKFMHNKKTHEHLNRLIAVPEISIKDINLDRLIDMFNAFRQTKTLLDEQVFDRLTQDVKMQAGDRFQELTNIFSNTIAPIVPKKDLKERLEERIAEIGLTAHESYHRYTQIDSCLNLDCNDRSIEHHCLNVHPQDRFDFVKMYGDTNYLQLIESSKFAKFSHDNFEQVKQYWIDFITEKYKLVLIKTEHRDFKQTKQRNEYLDNYNFSNDEIAPFSPHSPHIIHYVSSSDKYVSDLGQVMRDEYKTENGYGDNEWHRKVNNLEQDKYNNSKNKPVRSLGKINEQGFIPIKLNEYSQKRDNAVQIANRDIRNVYSNFALEHEIGSEEDIAKLTNANLSLEERMKNHVKVKSFQPDSFENKFDITKYAQDEDEKYELLLDKVQRLFDKDDATKHNCGPEVDCAECNDARNKAKLDEMVEKAKNVDTVEEFEYQYLKEINGDNADNTSTSSKNSFTLI